MFVRSSVLLERSLECFVMLLWQMPEMDGYQTTIAIRKFGFSGPIVAVTAMSAVEEAEKVKESGMNHIISKVATFRALCASLSYFSVLALRSR